MKYVGFDLGTTNSAAAVFDGEELTLVRSAMGGQLTPSVVRYNRQGVVSVGGRARRFLERDPDNTHAEFKRLMGTDKRLNFAAAQLDRSPQELSAEILKSLRADVEQQLGFLPTQAVVTVPALFEIPQNAATARAAELAGLDRVELLQEPVASALAAGWTNESSGSWLVYDLGGGTFDVSLLESRDGLLRVVGHAGDNFLGGRDFDRTLVDWLLQRLADEEGLHVERRKVEHQAVLRQLSLLAEEAKIDLTRNRQTSLTLLGDLEVDGQPLELDVVVERSTLEELCTPLVDRSIEICQDLLQQHGLVEDDLETVVLVGGPTVMPLIRQRISERLAKVSQDDLDPMALVAQGAALYAASAGLDARPKATSAASGAEAESAAAEGPRPHQLWLQYPAMSPSPIVHIIGRLAEPGDGEPPTQVEIRRANAPDADPMVVDIEAQDSFVATVELQPRRTNRFMLSGLDAKGNSVPVTPSQVGIVQGVTLSDPPLSRTLGVALADDSVKVYFERGVPLPARRMFRHQTIQPVIAGQPEGALTIPIVQGEFHLAHLCRLVGKLEISGRDLRRSLDVGTPIEITLELDRGGHLSAKAFIPAIDQVFEDVAQLIVPSADVNALGEQIQGLESRLIVLHQQAGGDAPRLAEVGRLDRRLISTQQLLEAAQGGDEDAAQKALREILEIESSLFELEDVEKWAALEMEALLTVASYRSIVTLDGRPEEQTLFNQLMSGFEQARASRSPKLLAQQLTALRRLVNSVYYRQDGSWSDELDWMESNLDECLDIKEAHRLLESGRKAHEKGDMKALKQAVKGLWRQLPATAEERRKSHFSGIR